MRAIENVIKMRDRLSPPCLKRKPSPTERTQPMTKLLCPLAILCLSSICFAQSNVVIRWKEGAPNTDRIIANGRTVKTIIHDGVILSVSLGQERLGTDRVYYDKFVATLYATNTSERRIEVAPDAVTLEAVRPKAKPLKRETAEHLSNSIYRRSGVIAALGLIGANMQTTQSTTTSYESGSVYGPGGSVTYSGNGSSTTTSPDLEARRRANDQAAALGNAAARASANLQAVELKANTLLPKQMYGGMLIFDRVKKCEEALLRVAIDGKVFEFPFTWQRK